MRPPARPHRPHGFARRFPRLVSALLVASCATVAPSGGPPPKAVDAPHESPKKPTPPEGEAGAAAHGKAERAPDNSSPASDKPVDRPATAPEPRPTGPTDSRSDTPPPPPPPPPPAIAAPRPAPKSAPKSGDEDASAAPAKSKKRGVPDRGHAGAPKERPVATGPGGGGKEEGADLAAATGGAGGATEEDARPWPHGKGDAPPLPASAPRDEAPPASVGLKAGSADDNLSFASFVEFVAKNGQRALGNDVSERLIVSVTDRDGRPVPDARVTVEIGGRLVLERRTYADGRALIFPSEDPVTLHAADAQLRVAAAGKVHAEPLHCAQCGRLRSVRLDVVRAVPQPVPLDIAIVLDTTGSMGDEIEQLRKTIEVIHFQLTHLQPKVDARFGMVLYKDRTDEERTRVVPFTRDLGEFRGVLQTLRAGGGGDDPEDVQAGLDDALHKLDWRADGVKVAFLIGDAEPHLDYGQTFTYVSAMKEAARRAIKFAAIGCSGLPITGEVAWRQLAQYTMGPYVFLSRGEKGDAEGTPSSVSHHVGSNWVAENLDAIIVRMVKNELAYLQPAAPQREPDFFQAQRPAQGDGEAVLQDLFRQSVKQLIDYSLEPLAEKTPTLLVPLATRLDRLKPAALRLESRLQLGLLGSRRFQLIDEKATPELIRVMEAQLSESYDSKKLVEAGKLVPAQLVVLGQLDQPAPGQVELIVKLVRLKTGEMLSLSLLKIDQALLQ